MICDSCTHDHGASALDFHTLAVVPKTPNMFMASSSARLSS
jgi:hypothetical protein